jgi:hypothetical protein
VLVNNPKVKTVFNENTIYSEETSPNMQASALLNRASNEAMVAWLEENPQDFIVKSTVRVQWVTVSVYIDVTGDMRYAVEPHSRIYQPIIFGKYEQEEALQYVARVLMFDTIIDGAEVYLEVA